MSLQIGERDLVFFKQVLTLGHNQSQVSQRNVNLFCQLLALSRRKLQFSHEWLGRSPAFEQGKFLLAQEAEVFAQPGQVGVVIWVVRNDASPPSAKVVGFVLRR